MIKGRKLTTSRSELLLGTYSFFPTNGESPELVEDEVWSVINGQDEQIGHNSGDAWSACISSEHVTTTSHADFEDPNKTKAIPYNRIMNQFNAKEKGLEGPPCRLRVAASAPINVPNWSKIYRVDSVESLYEPDVFNEDNQMDIMVPPHEYLACKYGRIASNSVFEGAGRTLKGRDMRRVRDSVWVQTGFNG